MYILPNFCGEIKDKDHNNKIATNTWRGNILEDREIQNFSWGWTVD